jgi:3-isopropylmalate/(R)-2-methylmalate dehydratase large subunit
MAIEAGGTSGICFPDQTTVDYLWPFIQNEFNAREEALYAFRKYVSDEDSEYDAVIDHDVSRLEPLATVEFKPDRVKPVRELSHIKIDQVYIGSCTNGRIEDLRIAAQVLSGEKISDSVRGILAPATTGVYTQAMEEGILKIFSDAGFCITNPTCGACLGMSNGVMAEGEVCASTTNRNFYGRMGKGSMIHLMSPATAAASAIAGRIVNSKLFESDR